MKSVPKYIPDASDGKSYRKIFKKGNTWYTSTMFGNYKKYKGKVYRKQKDIYRAPDSGRF